MRRGGRKAFPELDRSRGRDPVRDSGCALEASRADACEGRAVDPSGFGRSGHLLERLLAVKIDVGEPGGQLVLRSSKVRSREDCDASLVEEALAEGGAASDAGASKTVKRRLKKNLDVLIFAYMIRSFCRSESGSSWSSAIRNQSSMNSSSLESPGYCSACR